MEKSCVRRNSLTAIDRSSDCVCDKLEASLLAQTVKNLSAMRETQVRSLGWEDLLEKEMATGVRILAWRIPRTEEPCGLQFTGSQRVGQD